MVLLSRFLPAQVRRLVDGQALQRHRIHGVVHGHQLVSWEISKFKLKTQQKETMMQWFSSFYFKPIHWVTESRNPGFASSWFKMGLQHNLKMFETLQLGQVMFGPWVLGKFSSYCAAGSSDLSSTKDMLLCRHVVHCCPSLICNEPLQHPFSRQVPPPPMPSPGLNAPVWPALRLFPFVTH